MWLASIRNDRAGWMMASGVALQRSDVEMLRWHCSRALCMVCEEFFLEGGRRRRPCLARRYVELEAEEESREDWACEGQPDRAL